MGRREEKRRRKEKGERRRKALELVDKLSTDQLQSLNKLSYPGLGPGSKLPAGGEGRRRK